jgi:hypothetical protein
VVHFFEPQVDLSEAIALDRVTILPAAMAMSPTSTAIATIGHRC